MCPGSVPGRNTLDLDQSRPSAEEIKTTSSPLHLLRLPQSFQAAEIVPAASTSTEGNKLDAWDVEEVLQDDRDHRREGAPPSVEMLSAGVMRAEKRITSFPSGRTTGCAVEGVASNAGDGTCGPQVRSRRRARRLGDQLARPEVGVAQVATARSTGSSPSCRR